MTVGNLCEQCKGHNLTPWSQRNSPCGSSNRSSTRSNTTPQGSRCPPTNVNKPVYVRVDPCEKTCIVVGKGDGCGNSNSISVQLPSPPPGCSSGPNSNKLMLNSGVGSKNGSYIIKTTKGGLQIVPGKGTGAGMQISLGKGGCPIVQLGAGHARSCGNNSRGLGGLQVCSGEGGELQLSFGKGKCGGGPSIICGPGSSNVEISYGPQKRKLDMNHCKPTIAFMIHKRLVELERELRMAECTYNDMHS